MEKLTRENYCNYWAKKKLEMELSGRFKSEPKFLFRYDPINDNFVFNEDNWNGCDILRQYLFKENFEFGEDIEIKEFITDDTNYWFIFINYDFYIITWYKMRGRTDGIYKNGRLIDIDEYIELCNKLGVTLNEQK